MRLSAGSKHSALPSSIPHPIIRVLDKFVLEFDEALLGLPPVRRRIFERCGDTSKDLSPCGREFLPE